MTIKHLFQQYLETKQKTLKRPDAVCFSHGKAKGRSVYQSKLVRIIRAVQITKPVDSHEESLKQIMIGEY